MANVTWLGHAAFKIEIGGSTVLIDPWLDDNPTSAMKASEIVKADIVYVTHDHHDHVGQAFDICKRTGANFVATLELGNLAKENGLENVAGLNVGGSIQIGGIRLFVIQAFHSAARGAPTGVVVEAGGKAIYHAGDTALFGDMRLVGELYRPEVVLIPIGGYYTMGPSEAAEAVRLIKPRTVIPMHYKTFPVLAQTADEFVRMVGEKAPDVKAIPLKPGETYRF